MTFLNEKLTVAEDTNLLGKLDVAKDFTTIMGSDISTSGTIQDMANSGFSFARLSAASILESMIAATSGKDLILVNVNSVAILVKNETGATAANRIATGTGADITLEPGASLHFKYDPTAARWRVIGGSGAGSSGSSGRNYLQKYFNGSTPIGPVENSVGDTLGSSVRANPEQWGSSDTSLLTVTNTTSNPLREGGSLLLDSISAGVAFIETPLFTLDAMDVNGKPLLLNFDLSGILAANDYDCYVVRYDSSNVLQERLMVQSGVYSNGTNPLTSMMIPGTNQQFNGFWLTGTNATDKYAVRFRRLSASDTTDIRVDSLFSGPQTFIQGASMQGSTPYTPTSPISNTTATGIYKVFGSSVYFNYRLTFSGAWTGSLPIAPAHYLAGTPFTFKNTNQNSRVTWAAHDSSASFNIGGVGFLTASGDLYPLEGTPGATGNGLLSATKPFTWASGDSLEIAFEVDVNETSANTTIANRALTTFVADDGTNDVFGPNGAIVPNGAGGTGQFTRDIQIPSPKTDTSQYIPEYSYNGNGWTSLQMFPKIAGTSNYEFGVNGFWLNSGTYRFTFGAGGTAPSNGLGAASASTWAIRAAAGDRFRLRDISDSAASGGPTNSRNIVADTTGTPIPQGMLGSIIESNVTVNASGSTTLGTYTDITSINIPTPGVYEFTMDAAMLIGGATGSGNVGACAILALTDSSNNVITSKINGFANATQPNTLAHTFFTHTMTVSAPGTYKMRFSGFINQGTPTITSIAVIAGSGRPAVLKAEKK